MVRFGNLFVGHVTGQVKEPRRGEERRKEGEKEDEVKVGREREGEERRRVGMEEIRR